MPRQHPAPDRTGRWLTAVDVLALLRGEPGLTRAEVARRLGLGSGSAAEVTARLRDLGLLAEEPAPAAGRGRPTTRLLPHPEGPLVLVLELGQDSWRGAVAALDGGLEHLAGGRHRGRDPAGVLAALSGAAADARARFGRRLRVVSVAVAATVSGGAVVQAAGLGWGRTDLGGLAAPASGAEDRRHLPLLIGNEATVAAVAEARSGAATDADVSLHLRVDVGLGGALVVGGLPVLGATGAAGEYGHMPFGDPGLRCPCGARGCWGLEVDGRALARHLGEPPPDDAVATGRRVLDRAGAGDPAARAAAGAVAAALARGAAALVNAHDPDVVTLGGLARDLRAAAPAEFTAAYVDGLMAFRRSAPPPVRDAATGPDGPLLGAATLGLDHVTGEESLARWAAERAAADGPAAAT